jgi:septal ring factor EnvC (AmiA/AmiB activator)
MLLIAALALTGACATQQALTESDRRIDEIALRVAAVENTTPRLAGAQQEQARVQVEAIARLEVELARASARIEQLEAGGLRTESRLGAIERRLEKADEQLRAVIREVVDRFTELAAKVTELEAAAARPRVEPPRPVVRPRPQPSPAARVVPKVEVESPPARQCCKICTKGIPCGNTCIAAWKTCHKGPGCAC